MIYWPYYVYFAIKQLQKEISKVLTDKILADWLYNPPNVPKVSTANVLCHTVM